LELVEAREKVQSMHAQAATIRRLSVSRGSSARTSRMSSARSGTSLKEKNQARTATARTSPQPQEESDIASVTSIWWESSASV